MYVFKTCVLSYLGEQIRWIYDIGKWLATFNVHTLSLSLNAPGFNI